MRRMMTPILSPTEEIKSRLDALDREAVRPLMEVVAGTATDADRARLAEIKAAKDELRHQLGGA